MYSVAGKWNMVRQCLHYLLHLHQTFLNNKMLLLHYKTKHTTGTKQRTILTILQIPTKEKNRKKKEKCKINTTNLVN